MSKAATQTYPNEAQSTDRPGAASGNGSGSALAAMIKQREMGENERQDGEIPPSGEGLAGG